MIICCYCRKDHAGKPCIACGVAVPFSFVSGHCWCGRVYCMNCGDNHRKKHGVEIDGILY